MLYNLVSKDQYKKLAGMKKMDQESLISNAKFCFVNVQNSVITNLQVSKIIIKIDK